MVIFRLANLVFCQGAGTGIARLTGITAARPGQFRERDSHPDVLGPILAMRGQERWRCYLVEPGQQVEQELILDGPFLRRTGGTIDCIVPVTVTVEVEPDVDPERCARFDDGDLIVYRGPAAIGQNKR